MTADAPGDAGFSVDAFHRGRFHLVQPALKGHRAGVDAMILAAAVPDGFDGLLADLGAGAGAAGLAVASRCPDAHIHLVERAPEMIDCARRTLALEANRDLAARTKIVAADVGLAGRQRAAGGLDDNRYDFAITNPPFNAGHDRPSPDALRREAHVMDDGLFEAWLKTAAAILNAKGRLAMIARPASLDPILAASRGRFGAIEIMPVHSRAQEAAIRIVVRAQKGSRAEPRLLPPLVLHGAAGNGFARRAEDLLNGRAALFDTE